MHDPGSEPQKLGQTGRRELPGKQETHILLVPIIITHLAPQRLQELLRDLGPHELRGVGPAPGPVHPRQGAIRVPLPQLDADEGGKVVLVGVTGAGAVLMEDREVGAVRDDLDGKGPVHLEPLGALAPLGEGDLREHEGAVAAAAYHAGVVIGHDVVEGGVEEVRVDGGEVEEGDAGLGEEDEALVRDVQEGVG